MSEGSWGKETKLSGLNNDFCQLFSFVHTFTSIQDFYCVLYWWLSAWHKPCQHIQICEGATLSLCQKSCFFNALGRSWASLVCAQAARAQINDYLPTFLPLLAQLWVVAGCCPVSNFPVQKTVGSFLKKHRSQLSVLGLCNNSPWSKTSQR